MADSDSRDVLIGHDSVAGNSVLLPYGARDRGVALIGKSGTGKSSLLEHLIRTDLHSGTPGIVIDPHGSLAASIIRQASPEEAERIILLEAIQTLPFGLNLLDVRAPIDEDDDPVSWAADSVVETIKKLYGEADEFLPRLENYMDLACRTLIPNGRTLLDALRLFRDDAFREASLSGVQDRRERGRLASRWLEYERLRPVDRTRHVEALVNRLERLLAPIAIRGVVGSKTTTVPFDAILSGDRMLIVSLPSDRLSPERCDFIGALLLCSLADRIFARNVSQMTPSRLHIYLDEYQRFATSTTAELFEEGRKYNVGVTVAHQSLYQIEQARTRNAARHAGSLIVLQVADPDAQLLAGEFPITPRGEWLERIEELDGLEPELVYSSTPGEDILRKSHANPAVWEAANRILGWTGREGPLPHPARDEISDARLIAPPGSFDALLVDAMTDNVPSPEELGWRLLTMKIGWQPVGLHAAYRRRETLRPRPDAPTRYIVDGCTEWGTVPEVDAFRGPQWGVVKRVPIWHARERRVHGEYNPHSEDHHVAYLNQQLEQLWTRDVAAFFEGLSSWFNTHLAHLDALAAGAPRPEFKQADEELVAYAIAHRWSASPWPHGDKVLIWHGQDDPYSARGNGTHAQRLHDALRFIRLQVGTWHRWLTMLLNGLRADPILVPTSNQRPRLRTHHILHGAQTVSDARTEFANLLTNPPAPYVAQCRLPSGARAAKLLTPIATYPNQEQLDEVRERSRQIWGLAEEASATELSDERSAPVDDSNSAPHTSTEPSGQDERKRITRWPQEYRTEGEDHDNGE